MSPYQTIILKSAKTFGDFHLSRPGVSGLLGYFEIVSRPDLSGWLTGLQVPAPLYDLTVVLLPLMRLV